MCLKFLIAYFHQAATNDPIFHGNITLNNANSNNVTISWDSLTTLIETCLYTGSQQL